MKNASTHVKLLAVAIIWGVSWVAGKVVVQDFQPFTAGWVRYIIAVTCLLVFLRFSGIAKLNYPSDKICMCISFSHILASTNLRFSNC